MNKMLDLKADYNLTKKKKTRLGYNKRRHNVSLSERLSNDLNGKHWERREVKQFIITAEI